MANQHRPIGKEHLPRKKGKKSEENPSPPAQNRILIVGDWVVDEYWHLVRHHSDISSHTGFTHFRSSLKSGEVYMDLCGAGHDARVLHHLFRDVQSSIWGLGVWHPDDDEFLRHLVHGRRPDCPVAKASYRLSSRLCKNPPWIHLFNLDQEHGLTTRVVRLYHVTNSGTQLLSRVDWEIPHDLGIQTPPDTVNKLKLPNEVDAIVLHDLQKGVANEGLVKALHDRYSGTPWYVRTKKLNSPGRPFPARISIPEWLKILGHDLKLLLIGPEVLDLLNPWGRWLINEKISCQARDLLQELPETSVVFMSEAREVICVVNKRDCITTRVVADIDLLNQVGWPSAFFGSIIFEMIGKDHPVDSSMIKNAMTWANLDRISRIDFVPTSTISIAPVFSEPIVTTWERETTEWDAALQEWGIISSPGAEPHLDVWRGCTALPGYVACIPEKRDIINEISHGLRSFRRESSPTRSVSILLQADPGSGKTSLARSLAETFDFVPMKFDITQMTSREDLTDLFDSVATQQASDARPVLVFVDEVNATIAGGNVYGAFLSPLEDGVYVRRSRAYNLRPCAWIFAGTGLVGSGNPGDKIDDFISRMTIIGQFDFKTLKELLKQQHRDLALNDQARLEQIYLGATMIRRLYPDVDHVAKGVLKRFHDLDPEESPARKIRNLVMMLKNVQYGKITERNCSEWESPPLGESSLVKLVFEARADRT